MGREKQFVAIRSVMPLQVVALSPQDKERQIDPRRRRGYGIYLLLRQRLHAGQEPMHSSWCERPASIHALSAPGLIFRYFRPRRPRT